MAASATTYWLPRPHEWAFLIKAAAETEDPREAWEKLIAVSRFNLNPVQQKNLDRHLLSKFPNGPPIEMSGATCRLGVVGSANLAHLHTGIRIAGLRRNIWIVVHEGKYGAYLNDLTDQHSELRHFKPDAILIAFDARFVASRVDPLWKEDTRDKELTEFLNHMRSCWQRAREICDIVIQQTIMPIPPAEFGNNEHRFPGSGLDFIKRCNFALRAEASISDVDVLSIDDMVLRFGLDAWHSPAFWHAARQEINPGASGLFGDLVARLLAARKGRSSKCLVLDLDNTLWGGVVGDDGLDGIDLGEGSPAGEAFLCLQKYALTLGSRGVLLAICSKNDENTAMAMFERHPEMLLRPHHLACTAINWKDKAENLLHIANELRLGLDSLVFIDDSSFERERARYAVPAVSTPELPDDPALFAQCLADAGYFETGILTAEDKLRTERYQSEKARKQLLRGSADMESYLHSLKMRLSWRPFCAIDRKRIVQLVHKTNQFNLTTRRYTEQDIVAIESAKDAFGLTFRLSDKFGDHGLIGVVVGRFQDKDIVLENVIMSCRIMGRGVEDVLIEVASKLAIQRGARRLIGEYRPTAANGPVREFYTKLGFAPLSSTPDDLVRWSSAVQFCRSSKAIVVMQNDG